MESFVKYGKKVQGDWERWRLYLREKSDGYGARAHGCLYRKKAWEKGIRVYE